MRLSSALVLVSSLACSGLPVDSAPSEAVVSSPPSATPAAERGGRGGRRGGGAPAGCDPESIAFSLKDRVVTGSTALGDALDRVHNGTLTPDAIAVPAGACSVVVPVSSGAFENLDYVGITSDWRGLVASDGYGPTRGVHVVDLRTGKRYEAKSETDVTMDGAAVVLWVPDFDHLLRPGDPNPPAECVEPLAGLLNCAPVAETRWEAGVARPTGRVRYDAVQ